MDLLENGSFVVVHDNDSTFKFYLYNVSVDDLSTNEAEEVEGNDSDLEH